MPQPGAIALIAMPWPLFERPSIQLGALKAYVEKRAPHIQVEVFHHYVAVGASLGIELYQQIAAGRVETEFCYGALLFPEQRDQLEAAWRRRHPAGKKIALSEIYRCLEQCFTTLANRVDWPRFALVGFSHCTWQLAASLYGLRQLKARHPHLPVVLGGSGCGGEMGASLLKTFPEIDYVIQGEGETALLELAERILLARADSGFTSQNILYKGISDIEEDTQVGLPADYQVAELDSLPMPDYRPYFLEIAEHLGPAPFLATLPVEWSRGCWWQTATRRGCKFCNLNLQWQGYRAKSPPRLIHEIETLSSTYGCLDFALMDNVLPRQGVADFCQGLGNLKRDWRIFVELRADLPADLWVKLRQAGVHQVQIGIEALSASLLRKMGKGTTVMDNIHALKCCAEAGIVAHANLIYDFPGASPAEVSETLNVLPFLAPFPALTPVRFFLGMGSPLYRRAEAEGLKLTGNHADYHPIWPESQFPHLKLVKQGYQVNQNSARTSWRPVLRALNDWQKHYQALERAYPGQPHLSYRDGGSFLLIKRLQKSLPHQNFRLQGRSREIYLYCRSPRSLNQIHQQFPHFSPERLTAFLDGLVSQRLMFREGQTFLALALREARHASPDD
ncbi:MAG: RiPP maturation radical SAM C-methyltransferase [Deltaproteobacteria bacterium]|nr:RiPP maturation radical SAM C-methyltransferase [Deltaproteobacteria bacterium]